MLTPVILFNLMIGLISGFQYFVQPHVMTNRGPAVCQLNKLGAVWRTRTNLASLGSRAKPGLLFWRPPRGEKRKWLNICVRPKLPIKSNPGHTERAHANDHTRRTLRDPGFPGGTGAQTEGTSRRLRRSRRRRARTITERVHLAGRELSVII